MSNRSGILIGLAAGIAAITSGIHWIVAVTFEFTFDENQDIIGKHRYD
ncbi:MAG: hypothetical protein HY290_20085 [Planctomycetia bacterium]|nr:hypothetical protein [Planctomycetia bacterium]